MIAALPPEGRPIGEVKSFNNESRFGEDPDEASIGLFGIDEGKRFGTRNEYTDWPLV
jgi:hypothetical protein